MRETAFPFVALGLAALVLAALAISRYALPALAKHVPGATYNGSHAEGGTVDFDVSADGSGITRFRATDIPGDTCTFDELEVNFSSPVPIDNHSFSRQVNTGLSFQGTFPAPGSATGTLRAKQSAIPPYIPACDSGTITWNAATAVQPTPSPSPTLAATPTPTATATPTASPTPPSGEWLWGDIDCSGGVAIGDAQKIARDLIDLPVTQAPGCPPIGSQLTTGGQQRTWGDIDCGGAINIGDAQKIARSLIDLPISQAEGCPPVGGEGPGETATPTPTATAGANHPPAFPSPFRAETQTEFQYDNFGHLVGAVTTITITTPAVDPDGDSLTYDWSASNGSIIGSGLSANWTRVIEFGQPRPGTVTATVSDGRGGSDTAEFEFH